MNIESYFKKRLISRIAETELKRYINFFENSYKENLEHCKANLEKFPRWSIISGYYAMHDLTKLFIVKKFGIKIDFNVHKTTISLLKEITKDKALLKMLKIGYKEFLEMANDLAKSRKTRTKAQYYTGSEFMKEKYKEKSKEFLEKTAIPYINKLEEWIK
ncbi:hypothetical protein J4466_03140 [Candidatus Pacearchaeota archaeon]|nr:hypothetical protein [Candidatus Pacearchaeota archaeon]